MKTAQRLIRYSETAVANPLVSYGLIVALQLHVVWNIWRYADLTTGDTSYYYVDAATWSHGLRENFSYYPLYDAFYGTILAIVRSTYAATILQRVAILLLVSLLVLALIRALLGPAIALLIAAWWVVIPANSTVLYEVHLSGALPLLIAALVVVHAPRRQGLGIAVAILLVSAVLIRNELIASAAILLVACALAEIREARHGRRARAVVYLRAYFVPLVAACVVIAATYARSYIRGSAAIASLRAKEDAVYCTGFAASYWQEHIVGTPGNPFTYNPFDQCAPLIQHVFGRPSLSIFQAAIINPHAVFSFLAWTIRLLPAGLQVSLFGATPFANDPGYTLVSLHRWYAAALSAVVLVVCIAGLTLLRQQRKLSFRRATPRTRWVVVTLVSIAAADLITVLTSRPWSEYMFGLAIVSMVVIGASFSAVVSHLGGSRLLAPFALCVIVALIGAFPSFYRPAPRPVYDAVEQLQGLKTELQQPGSVLVAQDVPNEICNYLAYSYARICAPEFWLTLRMQVNAHTSVEQVLTKVHATVVYADAAMLSDPLIAQLVAASPADGWRTLDDGSGPDGPWRVLVPSGHSS